MNGTIAYALARKYAQKLSCGIQSSSYDPTTSTMQVLMNDGSSYDVVFDDGVSVQDRLVLDNIKYDEDTATLLVDGKDVLTKDDAVSDDDNLNFDGWFD